MNSTLSADFYAQHAAYEQRRQWVAALKPGQTVFYKGQALVIDWADSYRIGVKTDTQGRKIVFYRTSGIRVDGIGGHDRLEMPADTLTQAGRGGADSQKAESEAAG